MLAYAVWHTKELTGIWIIDNVNGLFGNINSDQHHIANELAKNNMNILQSDFIP